MVQFVLAAALVVTSPAGAGHYGSTIAQTLVTDAREAALVFNRRV